MCFPFSIKAQRFIVEGYFYLGGEMVEKKEGAIVADDAKEVKEPPTTEQQMETLQTQLKDVTVRAEKAESSVQGLRGSLTEKDTKIREQANLQAEIEDMKAMIKLTAFAQSQGVGLSEDDLGDTSKAEQPDVKKVWADLEQKREVAKEQDRQRVKADEYNRQALEVFFNEFLKNIIFQRQIRIHPLEFIVLIFKLPHPPDLRTAHAGVLVLPVVERGLTDAHLAADLHGG
ncbi:hypothetical protein LCGC14_2961950, partial [marine sediment metagenome]